MGKKADVVEDNVEYVEVDAEGVKGAFLGFGYPEWQVDGIIELFDLVNEGSSTMNVKDKDSDLSKFVSKPVSVKDFAQNMVPDPTTLAQAPLHLRVDPAPLHLGVDLGVNLA